MKKNVIKIFTILLLICSVYIIFPNNISHAIKDWSGVIDKAKPSTSTVSGIEKNATGIVTIIKVLLSFLQVASALVSILVIAFTGFNYIMASDADMKSEMKKKMLPLIIGLICVFSASSIASFLIGVTG